MRKTSKFYRFLCKVNLFGWYSRMGKFDKEWDVKLNSLMDNARIVNVTSFVAIFSTGDEVWLANHPYSSGYNWNIESSTTLKSRKLPSYKTLWKFEALVLNYIEEKQLQSKIKTLK